MKKSLVFLILSVVLFSCEKNTPASVAQDFVIAMNQNQFQKAKAYVDASSSGVIDEIMELIAEDEIELRKSKSIDFKVVKVEEENDKASVYYTIDEEGEQKHLHLTKINEQWKVSLEFMQKEDSHRHCNHNH